MFLKLLLTSAVAFIHARKIKSTTPKKTQNVQFPIFCCCKAYSHIRFVSNGRRIDFSISEINFFHQYLILNQTPWSISGILLIWLKNSLLKKVCDIWARCPLLKKSCQGFVVPWTLLSLINNKKSRSRSGFWLNWCKLSIEASILPICPVFVLGASQARVPSSFFTKEPSIEKGHFCKKGNQWSYINLLLLLLLKRRATELLVNSLPFSIQIYHWL